MGTRARSGDHQGPVDRGRWEVKYVSGPAGGTLGDGPRKEGEADGEALNAGARVKNRTTRIFLRSK